MNTVYIEILIVIVDKSKGSFKLRFAINNLICGRLRMTAVTAEVTPTVETLSNASEVSKPTEMNCFIS